jgi:hypothetical protein
MLGNTTLFGFGMAFCSPLLTYGGDVEMAIAGFFCLIVSGILFEGAMRVYVLGVALVVLLVSCNVLDTFEEMLIKAQSRTHAVQAEEGR